MANQEPATCPFSWGAHTLAERSPASQPPAQVQPTIRLRCGEETLGRTLAG